MTFPINDPKDREEFINATMDVDAARLLIDYSRSSMGCCISKTFSFSITPDLSPGFRVDRDSIIAVDRELISSIVFKSKYSAK